MSDKKIKPTTSSAIRNAMRQRREPPSELREPPSGLIQPMDDQEVPSWASEQTTQPEQDSSRSSQHGQIVMVPINKIRPGRYQKRETRDEEKYQLLKEQIKDLGFRFVAALCVDPDDGNFYNLMMGGHLRLEAASELGIEEVSAIICDYDQLALAKGTYYENNGRQRLTPIEEGRIFEQCMKDRGWTQEEVAEHLVVPGGRKYISFCITAANADADIQEVLRREPGRGRRCFSYLLRLDELGKEKAMKHRKPIIEDFLAGKISTDAVELRVNRILERERNNEAQEGTAEDKETVEDIKLQSKILTAQKSIEGLEKRIGVSAPSPLVRESLLKLKKKIEELLGR